MADSKKVKAKKLHINEENYEKNKFCIENVELKSSEERLDKKESIDTVKSEKKIKGRKLKDYEKERLEEERLDKEIEGEDNLSIGLIVVILVVCFVVGIAVGYILYRLAIDSSNVLIALRYFLK